MPTYKKPGTGGDGDTGSGLDIAPFSFEASGNTLLVKEGSKEIARISEFETEVPHAVRMGPGSTKIGPHAMGSGGENFIFKNTMTDMAWFPAWQGVRGDGVGVTDVTKRIIGPVQSGLNPTGAFTSANTGPATLEYTTQTTSVYYEIGIAPLPGVDKSQTFIWQAWMKDTSGDYQMISETITAPQPNPVAVIKLRLNYPLFIPAGKQLKMQVMTLDKEVIQAYYSVNNVLFLESTEALYQDVDVNAFQALDGNGNPTGRWFKPAARIEDNTVVAGLLEVTGPNF